MNLNKLATTVVTGFLGSGKTTLLSNLIRQVQGKRIAVIVNEFGAVDIDAELLRSCPLDCKDDTTNELGSSINEDNGIYELANGCICCTVEEEFLPVMQELINRREDIDHILIETSGLALPKPLVQAFNWPGIKEYCTVDAVITVIDGPAVAAGQFAHDTEQVKAQRLADESLNHEVSLRELLDDQLDAADLVVVTKNDLLTTDQCEQVQKIVDQRVPKIVKTLYVDNGQVPLSSIMGLDAATEERIETIHNHHDHHHHHGEQHDHAHDHCDALIIELGTVVAESLQEVVQTALMHHVIYRIKGFVSLPNKPMRQVLQAVGTRVDYYFDRPWRSDESRQTTLVIIGKDLDQAAIRASFNDCLA